MTSPKPTEQQDEYNEAAPWINHSKRKSMGSESNVCNTTYSFVIFNKT